MSAGADRIPAVARATANHVTAAAASSDWRGIVARSGLVAKGVLYAALGLLAVKVASGEASARTANQRGAIELVASQPLGEWLLLLLTVGLFALSIWQVILVIKGDPVDGSAATDRAIFAGKAFLYFGTAMTALRLLGFDWAQRISGGGSEASQDRTTAVVMSWPGGPWIVGLLGVFVVGAAIYQFHYHAMNRGFMKRLATGRMSRHLASIVERAGRAGYASRAIVLGIIGLFFIVAAVEHDARAAVGLSGALQAAARQTWGAVILWVVALGLLLYGGFCFAEARYRRST
jgi:hypothetical protein